MGGSGRARGPRTRVRVAALVLVTTVAAVLAALSTGSLVTSLEVAALVALPVGSAIAFGAFDQRRDDDVELAPDRATAGRAAHVLDSLDRIEHRRVELGAPWPQLTVGPTGVVVVDVCGLLGPLVVDAHGVRRRDGIDGCTRCRAALRATDGARRTLAGTTRPALPTLPEQDVPVRTVVVVPDGTQFRRMPDASDDVGVVTVDELAEWLTRGPVLPMSVVEATFAALTRSSSVPERP